MIFRAFLILVLMSMAAHAQEAQRTPSHCVALANAEGLEYIVPASLGPVAEEMVRIHYITHASFLIRSHGGL
ncbi:MAG: Zn-dependent hydrolase, partial [Pseudomonadota bacterium]